MKVLFVATALLLIVCVFILSFYEVDFVFNKPHYFVVLLRRRGSDYGYGIAYKEKFEIWRFGEKAGK